MNLRHHALVLALLLAQAICQADELASAALAQLSAKKTKLYDVSDSKAKGPTNFRVRYPESWGISDFARPGIVARIASANGDGIDSLVIVVNKSNFKGGDPTPDNVFTSEFFAKFPIKSPDLVRMERFKHGAFDGAVFEYFLEQLRPPMKVRTFVTNYTFTQNGALVQLQFYTLLGEEVDKERDEARISAFQPVWKAILETLEIK